LLQPFKILFISLLICSVITKAQQNYSFQHLTTKDGLASDLTVFIFQDSKGYYWIGNDNGFQKFDGKNFSTTSFRNKYINTQLLDETHSLLAEEDKAGNVFIFNQGSIYVYHPAGEIDTIQVFDSYNNGFSNITSFCKDEMDNIWIATNINLYKYDKHNNKCILWLTLDKKKTLGSFIGLIYDARKKSLWLARDNNILLVNINTKKVTQPFLSNDSELTDLPTNFTFIAFWMDSNYNLWISALNGLVYKYNTITYKKEVLDVFNNGRNKNSPNRSIPICFTEDKQKRVWIGCLYGGLYVYDERSNHINAIPANNNVPYAFHYDYSIYPLYQDTEGNIWAGTDKGINVFNPSLQQFNNVDENSLKASFQKPDLTSIFQTSTGDILVGSWGKGWLLFDKNFQLKKQFYDSAKILANDDEQRKNYAWCFSEDHNGKVWIGYQHGLIGIFDLASQHIEYIDVPEFNKKTIVAIQCDTQGNIWFGLHSGVLAKWDLTQRQFFTYEHQSQRQGYNELINDILIDRQGNIWIATNYNGFYCFDPITKKYTVSYIDEYKNSIYDNTVTRLTQVNDSVIGICNKFKGFLLFNQKRKNFTSFTEQNGLPITDVWGIAQDKQHNIWIATKQGLLRMNEKNKKIISFDEEDGLLLKKFQGNIVTLSDGRMAIPAETGFVFFSPDKINNLPAPPNVTITGFSIYDKPLMLDSALAHNNTVNLNHNQNYITISFASISFSGRNSTQYFYKLDGINKDWISTNTQRSVNYTNLNPGKYIFRIRCENRDGIPSKNIITLLIYISPPWWATWWAYTLYVLMSVGIIYALYYNRIQQLRKKQAAQLSLMIATQEEERKRISRDLHDDVGTKLSALKLFLSSLYEKAAETNNEEIKKMAASSAQFVTETIKDVRELLLNLSPSVLEEFGYTIAVEGLINKINETKQIHFSLVLFGMQQRLKKEHELALYRITQELINNVLKHADAKNVSLQIGKRDNIIILMIEDDGKGFDTTAQKNGYGLYNLDARTKLLQGTMTIDSQPGKGTSVLIEIPDNFN
jgi:signal transduction histidine kinase/ligand-binding sensor domain-containing protein